MVRPKKVLAFVDKRRSPLSSTNNEEILVIVLVNEKRYGHDGSTTGQTPKDVSILRYNDYMERMEPIQSIQCSEKVIGIEYFIIGHGINQENFLAIIEENHIVMYKFLKSKHEFIVFQRITSGPIRHVNAYGDAKRMFVMAIILQSNDIYFITYNSLRFIYSPINIRVYVNPVQPIYLKRIFHSHHLEKSNDDDDHDGKISSTNNVYLMIGAMNGIRLYSIRFFHDNNLFKLWTDHLNWCHMKRNEIADLEKHSVQIEKRFHQSYFKSDPLIIRGTLKVLGHRGTVVETDDYRHMNNNTFRLNSEYFNELHSMKRQLISIEKEIQKGHELLTSSAVFINSDQ
ncbi:hypothetical protein BLA29_003346, partial [Euroglyphus maynei]